MWTFELKSLVRPISGLSPFTLIECIRTFMWIESIIATIFFSSVFRFKTLANLSTLPLLYPSRKSFMYCIPFPIVKRQISPWFFFPQYPSRLEIFYHHFPIFLFLYNLLFFPLSIFF